LRGGVAVRSTGEPSPGTQAPGKNKRHQAGGLFRPHLYRASLGRRPKDDDQTTRHRGCSELLRQASEQGRNPTTAGVVARSPQDRRGHQCQALPRAGALHQMPRLSSLDRHARSSRCPGPRASLRRNTGTATALMKARAFSRHGNRNVLHKTGYCLRIASGAGTGLQVGQRGARLRERQPAGPTSRHRLYSFKVASPRKPTAANDLQRWPWIR